jgi:hypothetical protein
MLQIIGAGFGRTGTLSMKAALERLGLGPCYHMFEVFAHPEHVPVFTRAGRGEPVEWEDVFGSYSSAVDWPVCTFYRQLMDRYPDAPVLLTVRDPESWCDSFLATIRQGFPPYDDEPDEKTAAFREVVAVTIMRHDLGDDVDDRGALIDAFTRHNAEVRAVVPRDRLVEYTVGDGWEPLCAALGVAVPDEPFPHLNDRAQWTHDDPDDA